MSTVLVKKNINTLPCDLPPYDPILPLPDLYNVDITSPFFYMYLLWLTL